MIFFRSCQSRCDQANSITVDWWGCTEVDFLSNFCIFSQKNFAIYQILFGKVSATDRSGTRVSKSDFLRSTQKELADTGLLKLGKDITNAVRMWRQFNKNFSLLFKAGLELQVAFDIATSILGDTKFFARVFCVQNKVGRIFEQ